MNDAFNDWFEEFDNAAYDAGFSASGTSIDTVSVTAMSKDWTYGEPNISFAVDIESDGESQRYYLVPTIEFPTLDCATLPYGDSVEYYCNLFSERLGAFCLWLNNNPYIEYDYENE